MFEMTFFSLHTHYDSFHYQIWKPKRIRGHLWSFSIHSSTKNPMSFSSFICLPQLLHDPTSYKSDQLCGPPVQICWLESFG